MCVGVWVCGRGFDRIYRIDRMGRGIEEHERRLHGDETTLNSQSGAPQGNREMSNIQVKRDFVPFLTLDVGSWTFELFSSESPCLRGESSCAAGEFRMQVGYDVSEAICFWPAFRA